MYLQELSQRSIIGFLYLRREKASRKLFGTPMILNTFTAHPFSNARFIGTGAKC